MARAIIRTFSTAFARFNYFDVKHNWYQVGLLTKNSLLVFCRAKRGMDFGVNRGASAIQASKHLMGIQAANFAGRKRRSE